MGAGLNIKNAETQKLARKLADETDETLTGAITEAIRERLARVEHRRARKDLTKRLRALGRQCRARLGEGMHSSDHADMLYDERGLPK